MHMLIWAIVVCKPQSQGFSHRGPYDIEAQASWPPPGYVPDVYSGRLYLPNTFLKPAKSHSDIELLEINF